MTAAGPFARDVMTRSVLVGDVGDDLLITWELMLQAGVHHVPVLERGRCVGIVEADDIARECLRDPLGCHGRTLEPMTTGTAVQVSQDLPVAAVAEHLLQSGQTAVLVHDEASRLVGLITVHDLLGVLAGRSRPPAGSGFGFGAGLFQLVPVPAATVTSPAFDGS